MDRSPVLSRRALLRSAAGGAAVLATAGLPAWARPPATAAGRFRGPDSRPFPGRPVKGRLNVPSWPIVPGVSTPARAPRVQAMTAFFADAAVGRLPRFTFLDPQYDTTSEETPQDIQVGERFVARVTRALMDAPTWRHTALLLTYDEHGGYYDHVPPPRAVAPDSIAPIQSPGTPPLAPGGFDRYGFRVPLIVVSPWARPGYVSRIVQDHTSITAFVERKWNLPAMTYRDANAHPMIDYFDFRAPAFREPPRLTAAPALAPGLARCRSAGLNPPLPGIPG